MGAVAGKGEGFSPLTSGLRSCLSTAAASSPSAPCTQWVPRLWDPFFPAHAHATVLQSSRFGYPEPHLYSLPDWLRLCTNRQGFALPSSGHPHPFSQMDFCFQVTQSCVG